MQEVFVLCVIVDHIKKLIDFYIQKINLKEENNNE